MTECSSVFGGQSLHNCVREEKEKMLIGSLGELKDRHENKKKGDDAGQMAALGRDCASDNADNEKAGESGLRTYSMTRPQTGDGRALEEISDRIGDRQIVEEMRI
uniref:Uncharacterized protein n=1 Tax=Nelumbo nucifera TaxID=4432 RepID=A0A822Y835_NELNU|nr:TPA_asm: hypothetical protein HUJ06_028844 [Nelumbo nucifera]